MELGPQDVVRVAVPLTHGAGLFCFIPRELCAGWESVICPWHMLSSGKLKGNPHFCDQPQVGLLCRLEPGFAKTLNPMPSSQKRAGTGSREAPSSQALAPDPSWPTSGLSLHKLPLQKHTQEQRQGPCRRARPQQSLAKDCGRLFWACPASPRK